MAQYLAKYAITALECGFGGWLPYDTTEEHKFCASDDSEAREQVEAHEDAIRKKFYGPVIKLEYLVEIREIKKN